MCLSECVYVAVCVCCECVCPCCKVQGQDELCFFMGTGRSGEGRSVCVRVCQAAGMTND